MTAVAVNDSNAVASLEKDTMKSIRALLANLVFVVMVVVPAACSQAGPSTAADQVGLNEAGPPSAVLRTSSATGSSAQSRIATDPSTVPKVQDGGSRVRSYASIDELAKQSVAVVVAHGTNTVTAVNTAGVDFLVANFTVDKVLGGKLIAQGSRIAVRSFAFEKDSGRPVGANGGHVLLFLRPFILVAGTDTGEWVATDPLAGVFLKLADGRYHRIDPDSTQLPEAVDLQSLKLPHLKDAAQVIKDPTG